MVLLLGQICQTRGSVILHEHTLPVKSREENINFNILFVFDNQNSHQLSY
jgi:hypothetical protein